ncbi:MAG: hypothetical protein HYT75_03110 [Deltaproteobacteria bacterium]|nr:hypothetical protein [Deltaproteobacteria bacterium]
MDNYLSQPDDEINLIEYWNTLKVRKKLIAGVVAVITVVTIIISLISPEVYRSKATIMPIGKGGGGGGGLAGAIGQFGGLASMAGLGGSSGAIMQLMALLQTRTLAEYVVNSNNLMGALGVNGDDPKVNMERAVKRLESKVKINDDRKNGVINIVVEFGDPRTAADVANGYIEGLQAFINSNSFTVAKRNRIFIEKQLDQNKQDLLNAGKELNEFYKNQRVSSIESKVDVQIDSAGKIADTWDMEYRLMGSEFIKLADLQKERKKLDKQLDEILVVKDVPQQVYLQYLTLRRKLLEEINQLLTQQYEIAKIEEAKDELAFQTIDRAKSPSTRYKPKRKMMVIVGFTVSIFAGMFSAFFMNYLDRLKNRGQFKSAEV